MSAYDKINSKHTIAVVYCPNGATSDEQMLSIPHAQTSDGYKKFVARLCEFPNNSRMEFISGVPINFEGREVTFYIATLPGHSNKVISFCCVEYSFQLLVYFCSEERNHVQCWNNNHFQRS